VINAPREREGGKQTACSLSRAHEAIEIVALTRDERAIGECAL